MGKTSSTGIRQLGLHIALATCSLFMITPFIWQILTAFKSVPESRAVPPVFQVSYILRGSNISSALYR